MDSTQPNNTSLNLINIVWLIAIVLLLVFGGLLIGTFTPTIFPAQASSESRQIDTLFRFLLSVGGMVFLLTQGVLFYSIFRFRVRRGDTSDGPNVHGNALLEFIWTLVPTILVTVIAIYSYQIWVTIQAPKENEQVVQVRGARYAWTFEYYDEANDISFNSPVLHVYSGRPVRMEMNTEDVIHSFWVPAMRIKQDLLPGRTTTVRFTPLEAGEYRVVCTELCGGGHGQMYASIIVHEDEAAYLDWYNEQLEVVLNPPEDPVEAGRALLANNVYPCSGCHILDDLGWQGVTGPTLNGIGERAATRVPGLTAEEYLHQSIRNSAAYLVPGYGNLMPIFQNEDESAPYYMEDESLNAIVQYLLTQTS